MALVALGGKSPSEVAECLLDQHYLAVTKGRFKELQAFDEPRALFEELVASILPASVERNMPFLSGKESLTGGFVQAAFKGEAWPSSADVRLAIVSSTPSKGHSLIVALSDGVFNIRAHFDRALASTLVGGGAATGGEHGRSP